MGPTAKDVRATYERIADSYAASRRRPWIPVLDFIADLPPGHRVLDLGSGHGRHARLLTESGRAIVALDFSRRLLQIGRAEMAVSRGPHQIEWLEGDASALPFRDSTFDAALCIAVLHHIPSPEGRKRSLAELRRVLRPDGRALLSVWSADDPKLRELLGGSPLAGDVEVPWRLPEGGSVQRYYHLFQTGELDRLIIESGLVGERFFRSAGNDFAQARRHG